MPIKKSKNKEQVLRTNLARVIFIVNFQKIKPQVKLGNFKILLLKKNFLKSLNSTK